MYTIAVDFDNTIAHYEGWSGPDIIGEPLPGVIEALQSLHEQGAKIIIYTSRGELTSIKKWLDQHSIPYDAINESIDHKEYPSAKPSADIYIDDKGYKFEGDWLKTLKHVTIDKNRWEQKHPKPLTPEDMQAWRKWAKKFKANKQMEISTEERHCLQFLTTIEFLNRLLLDFSHLLVSYPQLVPETYKEYFNLKCKDGSA